MKQGMWTIKKKTVNYILLLIVLFTTVSMLSGCGLMIAHKYTQDLAKCEAAGLTNEDGEPLSVYECSYIMSPPNKCIERGGCDLE